MFFVEVIQIGIAENIQAVIDRHHHHVAELGQITAVQHRATAAAGAIAAAVDVEHHRPPRSVNRRREDVQNAAVLAERLGLRIPGQRWRVTESLPFLHAAVATLQRVAHAGPARHRLRRHETVAATGVGRIGHALEADGAIGAHAKQLAVVDFHDHGFSRGAELARLGLVKGGAHACLLCSG